MTVSMKRWFPDCLSITTLAPPQPETYFFLVIFTTYDPIVHVSLH